MREFLRGQTRRLRSVEAVLATQGSAIGSTQEHLGVLAGEITRLEELIGELGAVSRGPDPWSVEALIGYKPTPEQQMELFAALAEWQATIAPVEKNRTASFRTKERDDGSGGAEVNYGYADLAAVLHQARSAGKHGIAVTCQLIRGDGDQLSLTALALHKGGGALSSGPWTPSTEGNRLTTRNQQIGGAMTSARRLLIQNLMGIAAEEDNDFNATGSSAAFRGAPRGGGGTARRPRPLGQGSAGSSAPRPTKPPEGWLPKSELDALNNRLADPAITPDEFQAIETRLQAHQRAIAAMRSSAASGTDHA